MDAVTDLLRDEEAPPASGVRVRVAAVRALPGTAAPSPGDVERDVLAHIAEEVFFEVWETVRVLSPLQGAWFGLDLRRLATAALTVTGWRCGPAVKPADVLRRRWPELVPGHAAMDRLVGLMVDALC
jgi:hypothetical protein